MKFLFGVLMIFWCYRVQAQRPHNGGWLSANVPVTINKQWQWHNDGGFRTLGMSLSGHQYLYRTGLRHSLSSASSVAGGVAFFFTRTSFNKINHEFGKEFRTWQEITNDKKIAGSLQLNLRFRTEQRFFQQTIRNNEFTAHRFRVRAGLTYSINQKWDVQFADEYMHQLAHGQFKFDQTRIILNSGYHISANSIIRVGYMWLKWPVSSQHIVTATIQQQIRWHGAGKS